MPTVNTPIANPAPAAGSEPAAQAQPAVPAEFAPITSQEQFDKVLGERLSKERAKYSGYDELKTKAEQFDQMQEQSKSELQKAHERAEKAERERDAERLNAAKQKAASDAGLPLSMAHRLVGNNAEELTADAVELAKSMAPRQPQPRPVPAQSGTSTPGGSDWLRDRLKN